MYGRAGQWGGATGMDVERIWIEAGESFQMKFIIFHGIKQFTAK